jgi:hypothetical protein
MGALSVVASWSSLAPMRLDGMGSHWLMAACWLGARLAYVLLTAEAERLSVDFPAALGAIPADRCDRRHVLPSSKRSIGAIHRRSSRPITPFTR